MPSKKKKILNYNIATVNEKDEMKVDNNDNIKDEEQ